MLFDSALYLKRKMVFELFIRYPPLEDHLPF